jgi:hypothetical protein
MLCTSETKNPSVRIMIKSVFICVQVLLYALSASVVN